MDFHVVLTQQDETISRVHKANCGAYYDSDVVLWKHRMGIYLISDLKQEYLE
jgi:hypothetical protein